MTARSIISGLSPRFGSDSLNSRRLWTAVASVIGLPLRAYIVSIALSNPFIAEPASTLGGVV